MNASSIAQGDMGRVAVLMGGWSAEREVSLNSGKAVHAALLRLGVDAHAIDADRQVLGRLVEGGFDRVFIVLHGRGGEDGTIQAGLDLLGLPYTGTGVLGSALGMDKVRTKLVWQGLSIPTPPHAVIRHGGMDANALVSSVGLPMAVKPAREGSTIGITRVQEVGQLPAACEAAFRFDDVLLAERWITGGEYTVSILGDAVLPMIRIEPAADFYDYEAKYVSNSTRYHCPCGLPAARERELAELARQAFEAVGASGWGRVDLILDEQGYPWFLEVNTVPGMTDHSLVPMAAKAAGIDFDELVWRILLTTMERPS
ncbi:MAG: D-alanine--D-alanine ligase [Aquisalimonadaceae bacterium]